MDDLDLRVRNAVYARFVADGHAPTAVQTAAELGLGEHETLTAFRRLHAGRAFVLQPAGDELWMLHPFSAVETPHRVETGGRSWFANCAWDALGIPAALNADGRVDSVCADCGEPVELEVREGELTRGADLLVHFLVPAAHWWDHIGFT